MAPQDIVSAVEQIKKTLENFMVSIGILIGTILLIYFFTYATLVDSTSSLIWFQVVTSVLMVLVLVYLRRVCFFLTRLKLGRRDGYRALLGRLQAADLAQDVETLAAKLGGDK